MNIGQEREIFEAWVSTQSVVKKYGAKLHRSSCGSHYKDLRINQRWLAFRAGRAAIQSQDREDAVMKELGKQAVRWAPSSAYWSAELTRLFGPDAREGINVLEARLRDSEADAARWRYMRRKLCLTGNGNGTCAMYAINLPEAINGWPEPGQVAEFCEAAIDHARRIEGGGE